MKAKNIATIVLLGFVGVSVAYLVLGGAGSDSATPETPAKPEAPAESPGETSTAAAEGDSPAAHKLIAYYFHRNQRCKTCRTIEQYAKESLEGEFPEAVKTGELEWRVVNVEEPANEHFVKKYELAAGAVVLVDTHDGKRTDWRNLDRVWVMVNDELKFKAYVAAEAMDFLEGGM